MQTLKLTIPCPQQVNSTGSKESVVMMFHAALVSESMK